jgi:hypothetical protein
LPSRARRCWTRLREQSHEIYAVSDAGVRLLTELFCEEVYLCLQAGSSRPEEGSEHHLLYALEYLSGRTYLHGAAVTLCALVMAHLQGNAPNELRALADACGVAYRAILAEVRRGRADGGGATRARLRPRGRLAVHRPDDDAHHAGTRASGGSVGAILYQSLSQSSKKQQLMTPSLRFPLHAGGTE